MDTSALVLRTQAVEPVVVLQVEGVLALADAGRAMAALTHALRAHRHGVVVCDVSRLEVTSRSLLMAFPAALRRAGRWPARALHLAEPTSDVTHHLLDLRMARYLPVHPTLTSAVAAATADAVLDRLEVTLEPVPDSVRRAREIIKAFYPSVAGASSHRDNALVIGSELATNAVRHVTEPFSLAMSRSRQQFVIAVHDASRQEPILRPPRQTAQHGRGMQVVDGLSLAWGVRLVHADGKTVWAALPVPTALVPARRSPTMSPRSTG
ncbi:MAG TPA: ATP-binding protein [Kineosporiaceae bacterium]